MEFILGLPEAIQTTIFVVFALLVCFLIAWLPMYFYRVAHLTTLPFKVMHKKLRQKRMHNEEFLLKTCEIILKEIRPLVKRQHRADYEAFLYDLHKRKFTSNCIVMHTIIFNLDKLKEIDGND